MGVGVGGVKGGMVATGGTTAGGTVVTTGVCVIKFWTTQAPPTNCPLAQVVAELPGMLPKALNASRVLVSTLPVIGKELSS